MIIAIVGMCGSGKSKAAEFFREKGMEGVYFGELTIERLRKFGLPINPENEKKMREQIRDEYGMDGFAVLAWNKISNLLEKNKKNPNPLPIYIDGLYSMGEYEFLEKKNSGKIFLIEIYADKDIRYRRLGEREYRPLTPEQCRERDWAEVKKLDKGGPIALSDYKVCNNGDPKKFYHNLESVLQELNSKHQ